MHRLVCAFIPASQTPRTGFLTSRPICVLAVMWLSVLLYVFLVVPWVGLWSLIMAFPSHTHFLFRHRNETILAILNLYFAPMHPTKFRFNSMYGLGGDVLWRKSTWLAWRPTWIILFTHNNLANFYLHVASLPPTKFRYNPTYGYV